MPEGVRSLMSKKEEAMKSLRGKDKDGLSTELLRLRREQFSLRMQSASGQIVKCNNTTFTVNRPDNTNYFSPATNWLDATNIVLDPAP